MGGLIEVLIQISWKEVHNSSRESEQFDLTILPPTHGWKSIKSAYQSPDDVPKFQ